MSGQTLLSLESSTQIYYGRLGQGREFMRAAVAAELRDNLREAAAIEQIFIAIVEAEFGRYDRACQLARTAVALSPGRDVRILAAAALASARDLTGAQKHIDDLDKEFPLDTLIQNYWLPAIRARIELHKGHPGRALELLQSAQPYELALTDPRMYVVYISGKAHLATGNSAAAAANFQKILDHPALVGNSVTGPLARLHLARARALEARSLQGQAGEDVKTKARAVYQDFFTLWKDADPDIPILKQAKIEYAKLQ